MKDACDLQTMSLPDGRRISFAAWGRAEDPPVILMHGWPGSRLCGRLLADAAEAQRVRLIVPDRPGMGRSDPKPARTLLGGARDTAALADCLGLDRFAVVGYSGGAPYALACASLFPERLLHTAVVSGLGPLEDRSSRSVLPPHLKMIFSLSRQVPGFARLPARMISFGVRRLPEVVALQARLQAAGEDRRVLARKPVFDGLRAEYTEAFRQGSRPVADEVRIYTSPWGFPLTALRPRIHIYHGDADRFIPAAMGRELARRLPAARCLILPDAGHFWIVDHFGAVLKDWKRGGR